MKKTILFLLLFGSFYFINAQTFKLGFDLEAHQIRLSGNQILGDDGLPLSYHLDFIYKPSKNISILTKIGKTLSVEFAGWEFGIEGKYNFYKPLFITGGLLAHLNDGGGISNSLSVAFASIFMIQAGISIDLSPVTSIELNYYIPTTKKVIGWSKGFGDNGEDQNFSHVFKSMIRFGFVFGWEL